MKKATPEDGHFYIMNYLLPAPVCGFLPPVSDVYLTLYFARARHRVFPAWYETIAPR